MQKRKFDHDQVNDLLVRTVNPVQKVLAKNYEPGIAVVDFAMGRLDERGVRLAAAHLPPAGVVERARLRRRAGGRGAGRSSATKLERESYRLAEKVQRSPLWRAELAVNRVVRPLLADRWAAVPLERRCHDHRRDRPVAPPLERNRALPAARVRAFTGRALRARGSRLAFPAGGEPDERFPRPRPHHHPTAAHRRGRRPRRLGGDRAAVRARRRRDGRHVPAPGGGRPRRDAAHLAAPARVRTSRSASRRRSAAG